MEDFKTPNMGLVAFLKYHGYGPRRVAWRSGACYWYFTPDKKVLSLAQEYDLCEGSVEPSEYNRQYGATRREFFETKRDTK